MAGSVRILKNTGEEFDITELESDLYGDPPAQFDSAPMHRKPLNADGLTPEEVMALSASNSELPYSEFPNPYELDLSQHGFSEPEFDPMQAHLDEEDARRKLKEGVESSRAFVPEDLRYPEFRRTSPRRYDDPPNPFKKSSPLDAAWALLKASPTHEIREALSYSDEFDRNPAQVTANPIIERLIRERNEANYRGKVDQKGRSLAEHSGGYGLEGELPAWANPYERPDPSTGEPYTPRLLHSTERLHRLQSPWVEPAGYAHFGPTGTMGMGANMTMDESRAANAARGVERGDRWSGDYVVGQNRPSRSGENRAFTNSPYGSRAGGHKGPMNVEPGSPMAQMYNMAPQLATLPEGLQPDWMSEFR